MQDALFSALAARRGHIRARWEDLLRLERATSPLANPDALVHLIGQTLDEFYAAVSAGGPGEETAQNHAPAHGHGHAHAHAHGAGEGAEALCPCGRNPFLVYFTAGRQALREGLVMSEASMPVLDKAERDGALVLLDTVYRRIEHREVAAFCALCQFRSGNGSPRGGGRSEVASVTPFPAPIPSGPFGPEPGGPGAPHAVLRAHTRDEFRSLARGA